VAGELVAGASDRRRPDVAVNTGETRNLRARGSGIEFDSNFGFVIWIERGLVVREADFADWQEAIRSAGI
jgi:hypothetical protein